MVDLPAKGRPMMEARSKNFGYEGGEGGGLGGSTMSNRR